MKVGAQAGVMEVIVGTVDTVEIAVGMVDTGGIAEEVMAVATVVEVETADVAGMGDSEH